MGVGLIIIFSIIGIIISAWNAYASGHNSVVLRDYRGKFYGFFQISNSFSVVLAFAGATYYTALLLGIILSAFKYITYDTLISLYSLNFLVFGGLITFTGVVIMIQSILVAYYNRNWKSILIAVWNVFASIWNVFIYLSNFIKAYNVFESSDERSKNRVYILIAIAALIGLLITYFSYRKGVEDAERKILI